MSVMVIEGILLKISRDLNRFGGFLGGGRYRRSEKENTHQYKNSSLLTPNK
jgi:hypothetical protein